MPGDRPKLLPRKCIPLLVTESSDEFEELRATIKRDFNPRNEIERLICDDVVQLSWDIKQWRRWRVAILNLALSNALYEVLVDKLDELDRGQETVQRLKEWFSNEEAKREISEILEQYGLDESVIEAVAFHQCATELTLIEQLLAAAEARRVKAILQFDLCRERLARCDKTIDVTQRERPPLSVTKRSSAG